MSNAPAVSTGSEPKLRRVLGLWDLILYGLIVIQPTAPMPVFGVMSQRSQNHAVTTVLIAMVAMLFTAISYGRMARAYPSAGSAFTYVGQEIHPALGFVTGWGMAMDYMLNPLICTILCSKFAMNSVPGIPYALWAVFFALLFTGLNLFGIRTSARINEGLAAGMGVVIGIFLVAAARYVFAQSARRGDVLHPAVLRLPDILTVGGAGRNIPGGSHLHRFRRHLHAVRGGGEPAAQHPSRHRPGLPDHRASWPRSRSTPPSWSGRARSLTRMWRPPTCTWRAAPAGRGSFR